MPEPLCIVPVEWGEGPCEHVTDNSPTHWYCGHENEEFIHHLPHHPNYHAYQPPVVRVCGHPREDHFAGDTYISGLPACEQCGQLASSRNGAWRHAFKAGEGVEVDA